jgi:hypothetical protein
VTDRPRGLQRAYQNWLCTDDEHARPTPRAFAAFLAGFTAGRTVRAGELGDALREAILASERSKTEMDEWRRLTREDLMRGADKL